MKDANVIEESVKSQKFDESRHSVLCSELKQIYVAITRTRHRLWICENKEELCLPMYDYWKRMRLVSTVKLNKSVAQAMRATSSIEEWKNRGTKVLMIFYLFIWLIVMFYLTGALGVITVET